MFKRAVVLVFALSSLLILAAGCQTPAPTDQELVTDTNPTPESKADRNFIMRIDDWIRKNLW